MPFDFVPFGQVDGVDLFIHLQDGVDRALFFPGHVADNIDHRHEVLVVDALLIDGFNRRHQGGQGDQRSVGPGDLDGFQPFDPGPGRQGKVEDNGDLLPLAGLVQQAHLPAAQGQLQRLGDTSHIDAVEGGFLFVHHEVIARLIILHIPVHIHHFRRFFKNRHDPAGDFPLPVVIRAVNLRHQG